MKDMRISGLYALNYMLPGNPRYQPKELTEYFGYDNLFRYIAEVEIATMKTLADIGIIPPADIVLLTPEVEQRLLQIRTSEVDEVERKVTKHDIRAWVQIAKERSPEGLRRWIHIPLTSYDVLDTARSLQFTRAHVQVVKPLADEVVGHFIERTRTFAEQKQIGRTHGQHALPITVGFWFATILSRILRNLESANTAVYHLVGKISGAVGAYNAQKAVGIIERCKSKGIGSCPAEDVALGVANYTGVPTFESLVLKRLGLKSASISTQILPPEPLADYLFACVKLSASLGQFGRDGRHLMRSEIAELCEPFDKGQVGSSTMAHKRNPINFENLESTWLKTKNEFGKVMDTLISEHQRDLVNSAIARDCPTIVVNLVSQLNTLLRGDPPFISRISVDSEACERNLALQSDNILAEPIYIALQMSGYMGDAHDLVNHKALAMRKEYPTTYETLYQAVCEVLEKEGWKARDEMKRTFSASIVDDLMTPEKYTGLAVEKALEVAKIAEGYLATPSVRA
jgi:adenylosuccinate lyase